MRRHAALAALSVAWVALLTGVAIQALPWTYRVQALILAQRNPTIGQLVNPGRRGVAQANPPAHGAYDQVLALDNLLSIVQRSGAVDAWNGRSPATRLANAVLKAIPHRATSREDQERALAGLLERRLQVASGEETVAFSLDWQDRAGGERLVEAAVANFIEARERQEEAALAAAISVLARQVGEVEQQLDALRTYRRPLEDGELRTLDERRASLRLHVEDARLEARAVEASFRQRFVVLRPPESLKDPVSPRPILALLAALLGGLLVGLVASIGADLGTDRIFESWQLERETGLPVIGEIALPQAEPLAPRRPGPWTLILTGGLGLATAGVIWYSGGNVAAAAVPALAAAVAWAVARAPLRWTVSTLLLLWLCCDLRTDAQQFWHTPLHFIGDFFVDNLGTIIGVPALKVSGLELTLVGLLGLILYRKATGSRIDGAGQVQAAAVLGDFVALWLLALGFASVNGLMNGGQPEVLIWHARPMLAYALLTLVYQAAFRGPADHRNLGRIVVIGGLVKAAMCIYIMVFITPFLTDADRPFDYATNHHDSITFALAVTVLLAYLAEKTDRRRLAAAGLLLPILVLGMVANRRRLVWIELAMVFVTVYLMSPWRAWKRALTRTALVAAPAVALYLAAGWSSPSAIFKPVAMLRSIVDSKSDRSTLDRDLENWNLLLSMRERPVLGRGFGHEYTEYWLGDDISGPFPMYKAVPHNGVLGLLLFSGALGFLGFWLLLGVGVFLAARAYHRSRAPIDRAAALCCIAAVLIVFLQGYGDMGLISLQSRVLLPLALVTAAKLAVATGAWPKRTRSTGGGRWPAPGAPR